MRARSWLTFPAGLLAVALLTNGCSFLFVRGTPALAELPDDAETVSCTDSRAAPAWDLVFASLGGVGTATSGYEAMQTVKTTQNNLVANLSLAGNAALMILFTASTVYGFGRTAACRDVRQSLDYRAQHARSQLQQQQAGNPPPAPLTGCAKDTDCKGDRVCSGGKCVTPHADSPPDSNLDGEHGKNLAPEPQVTAPAFEN